MDDIQSPNIVYLEHNVGKSHCKNLKQCNNYKNKVIDKLVGRYIAINEPFEKQVVAACLNLKDLTKEEYISKIKKRYKGNVIRDARKSDKGGFYCKIFNRNNFIPDIVEINQSKDIRCGGPMKAPYRRSVEEMGGFPKNYLNTEMPECPLHYDIWWGAFENKQGYTQGSFVTDEKLIAYVNLRRIGNTSFYNLILGHGDYLQYGIMYKLHFEIMDWICDDSNIYSKGLENLIYAGFYQGKEGLMLWKKKTCFEPSYIVMKERDNTNSYVKRLFDLIKR